MAKAKKWYKTGDKGWAKAKEEDEAAKKRREEGKDPRKNRFWLENDSAAKITWLDTPSFFLHEHNLKVDGRWGCFETCLKDFDTCPICEAGMNSSYIVVGTIISHKVWEDRAGNRHANEKILFVAKGRARQRLLRQIGLRDGDLTGCVYEMARGSGATECSSGEDFEFIGRLSKAKLKKLCPKGEDVKEFLKPLNYEEIFAPKSAKELRKIVGGEEPVGSSESEMEDDVPPSVTDNDPCTGEDGEEEALSIEDLL